MNLKGGSVGGGGEGEGRAGGPPSPPHPPRAGRQAGGASGTARCGMGGISLVTGYLQRGDAPASPACLQAPALARSDSGAESDTTTNLKEGCGEAALLATMPTAYISELPVVHFRTKSADARDSGADTTTNLKGGLGGVDGGGSSDGTTRIRPTRFGPGPLIRPGRHRLGERATRDERRGLGSSSCSRLMPRWRRRR
jgi:hypothetical protein